MHIAVEGVVTGCTRVACFLTTQIVTQIVAHCDISWIKSWMRSSTIIAIVTSVNVDAETSAGSLTGLELIYQGVEESTAVASYIYAYQNPRVWLRTGDEHDSNSDS